MQQYKSPQRTVMSYSRNCNTLHITRHFYFSLHLNMISIFYAPLVHLYPFSSGKKSQEKNMCNWFIHGYSHKKQTQIYHPWTPDITIFYFPGNLVSLVTDLSSPSINWLKTYKNLNFQHLATTEVIHSVHLSMIYLTCTKTSLWDALLQEAMGGNKIPESFV